MMSMEIHLLSKANLTASLGLKKTFRSKSHWLTVANNPVVIHPVKMNFLAVSALN